VAALAATAILAVGACTDEGGDITVTPQTELPSRPTATARPQPTSTTPTTQEPGRTHRPACDLLSGDEVADAVGEGVVNVEDDRDECWWTTDDDLKTVNLIIREDDVGDWRAGYTNDAWTPNDLGDEGYTGRILDSIVFRVGDVQYEVNVVYSTSGDPEQVVEELAELVESRVA
jgi:hypothetical protein